MNALMPGRSTSIPQLQALADDRVQEAFRLAGPRAGGDQRGLSRDDGGYRMFLVAAEVGDVLRNPPPQVRMQQSFRYQ